MLKSMLECLERHFMETDPKTAVEFLKQLIHVPRFGTVRLFMDSSEKKSKLFNYAFQGHRHLLVDYFPN